MLAAATYKLKRKALKARVVPPLLDKLAEFVGTQIHGSLGWFEGPTIEPVTGKAMPEKLRTGGIVFAWLPDGERVCIVQHGAQTPVVLTNPDGRCRLVAPSIEAFALAWAKGASGVAPLDHDGSLVVAHHGTSAATTRSVPSARKALAAWLKAERVKAPRAAAFDLDAFLGTTPRPTFDGSVPPPPTKLVPDLAAGKRAAFAAYGVALAKQGHPLAEVIAADVAALAEPKGKRLAKQTARATFLAYVKEHLAPRYSRLANNMIHFTDPVFPSGMGFRYGFLEELDTFGWTRAMVDQGRAFLEDDHARWALDLTPRDMTFESFAVFERFAALRRLNFRWSKITSARKLQPLANLRQLQALDISGAASTDLTPLRKVPLVQLYLRKTAVIDLSPLANHKTLECLDVEGTGVSYVWPLLKCPRLCNVGLWDTEVNASDAQKLEDLIRRTKRRPTRDQTYLIDGYNPGVSHNDT